MKDFRLFDMTDFIMDEDFIRWVYEQLPEDNATWNAWLTRNPDKHLVVAEARKVLESIRMDTPAIDSAAIDAEVNRLLHTLHLPQSLLSAGQNEWDVPDHINATSEGLIVAHAPAAVAEGEIVSRRSLRIWYAAAAVVFLCVSAGGYVFFNNHLKRVQQYSWETMTASRQLLENVNTSDKSISIGLPDGSTVSLSPHSRIGYTANFDSMVTRDVYLSGEAFFTVTKNPDRPFRVFANEIVTKVLGTSFTVRSFDYDTTIQVIVRTGKVTVYSQAANITRRSATDHKPGEVILTPNQQLVYEKAGQKFQRVLLDDPLLIVPRVTEQKMEYEDASLSFVFNELSKAYGINIVYDSELLEKCTVTADLKNETFYHKLDLICTAIGASYEVIDGQVAIQANGCE